MDNIQILSETLKHTNENILFMGVFLATIAIISLIFVVICWFFREERKKVIYLITIFIIFGLSSCCLFDYYYHYGILYKEYKVLINEDIKLNEFNEKYKIINQEGKIFTIIEKKK